MGEFSTMKCTITYFGDTEGELVPVGVWEVVVVVTEEEVGVMLNDCPADELRARSIGCTVVAELWFRWFMCPINLKGEAKKKRQKKENRVESARALWMVTPEVKQVLGSEWKVNKELAARPPRCWD
jgi:hypothetical protein